MATADHTSHDGTADPTDPSILAREDCDDCGPALACFDHHESPCPSGRYDCGGPRSSDPCQRCLWTLIGSSV